MSRLKVWSREAGAYARLGVRSAGWWTVRSRGNKRARRGVLFVPGVGAVGAHFGAFRRHLDAEWFGAFEYASWRNLRRTADELATAIRRTAVDCDEVVLIGHSLGGLLCRLVLQADHPPAHVAGWVSLCAPLHGTWRARLAPSPALRALKPDGPLITGLLKNADRLSQWENRIFTLAADHDLMLKPSDSARLPGHPHEEFEGVGHNAILLDAKVHRSVGKFVRQLAPLDAPASSLPEWI